MAIDALKNRAGLGGFIHVAGSDDLTKEATKLGLAGADPPVSDDDLAQSDGTSYYPQADTFAHIVDIASDAVKSIAGLRRTQLELAARAADSGDAKERDMLEAEYNNLQTEIDRIASSATYGTLSVFDGAVLTLVDQNEDVAEVNSIAKLSSLATTHTYSFNSQIEAEAAEDDLTKISLVTYGAVADLESKVSEAARIRESVRIDTSPHPQPEDPNAALKALEHAQSLAASIAQSLLTGLSLPETNPFSSENGGSVVHNLDPTKVAELLDED
jgi:hypothetical protein